MPMSGPEYQAWRSESNKALSDAAPASDSVEGLENRLKEEARAEFEAEQRAKTDRDVYQAIADRAEAGDWQAQEQLSALKGARQLERNKVLSEEVAPDIYKAVDQLGLSPSDRKVVLESRDISEAWTKIYGLGMRNTGRRPTVSMHASFAAAARQEGYQPER